MHLGKFVVTVTFQVALLYNVYFSHLNAFFGQYHNYIHPFSSSYYTLIKIYIIYIASVVYLNFFVQCAML